MRSGQLPPRAESAAPGSAQAIFLGARALDTWGKGRCSWEAEQLVRTSRFSGGLTELCEHSRVRGRTIPPIYLTYFYPPIRKPVLVIIPRMCDAPGGRLAGFPAQCCSREEGFSFCVFTWGWGGQVRGSAPQAQEA